MQLSTYILLASFPDASHLGIEELHSTSRTEVRLQSVDHSELPLYVYTAYVRLKMPAREPCPPAIQVSMTS